MAYVKWVANADRHNDWTSELLLQDGTEVKMGVPIDLKSDLKKDLEAQGRIFEDSSKDDYDEYYSSPEVIQPPGNDVMGTAPVFVNSGPAFNQLRETEQVPVDQSGTEGSSKPANKTPASKS